jgi:hypothetical protein
VLPPSASEALDKALSYSWIEPSEILRIKKWWSLAAKTREINLDLMGFDHQIMDESEKFCGL